MGSFAGWVSNANGSVNVFITIKLKGKGKKDVTFTDSF